MELGLKLIEQILLLTILRVEMEGKRRVVLAVRVRQFP
jgi:hypothetical protein